MNNYLDIRLLPSPEFTETVLMSALFGNLHRVLVEMASDRIGVSFPDFERAERGLGGCLRLHGSAGDLECLMAISWLRGLRDHVRADDVMPVPESAMHRVVRRVQVKSNPDRLRRRWMKHTGLSELEARRAIPDSVVKRLDLPYVVVTSRSTRQRFRLFIEHGPLTADPIEGAFNSYGLSRGGTVPFIT